MDLDTTWVRLRAVRRVNLQMLCLGFVCGAATMAGCAAIVALLGMLR
jgi:hypothetical protein